MLQSTYDVKCTTTAKKYKKNNDSSSEEESESEEADTALVIGEVDNENENDNDGNGNASERNSRTGSKKTVSVNNDTDDDYTDSDDSESEDDDDKSLDVPKDYVFPSFFVFIIHGRFVPASERLDILLVDNKDWKKGEGTRAQLRKKDASDKALESKHDTTSGRGFSTDQRIDIESLDVQKEAMQDRKREAALVGLSIEESAITKLSKEQKGVHSLGVWNMIP